MDEGESLKECWADGKLTGGSAWTDESEDESLWSSDLNPEELQDGLSEHHSPPDLKSKNKAIILQLESSVLESENLGDDVEDVHGASAEADVTTLQNPIQKMEVENQALKAQCDGIRSEMSAILSESDKKTARIAELIHTQQALEQQLEEYKISLDQSSQDSQEKSMIIECLEGPIEAYIAAIQELRTKNQHLEVQLQKAMMSGGLHVDQGISMDEDLGQLPPSFVEEEEQREQGQRDGIQEQSPVCSRAQVQTKSWWRRQAKGLRKVLRRMGTFSSCMGSNKVHPFSD